MVAMETRMATTPLPLPAHFAHAEQSFSAKRRRLPSSSPSASCTSSPAHLSFSLPPRPPSKGCPLVSRVFPPRGRAPPPWTPLSRSLADAPPPPSLYDAGKQQSYFSQCFTNLGLLGRGSFGEVYKVLSHKDGRHYAVKRSVNRFRGAAERGRSVREARNHERLPAHPHILGFLAAWEEAGRLYIQTELCCTSLLLHAERQPPTPDEPAAWSYLCDLLSALQHLHSRGFAHLDLKPANVFLTGSGRLKLGDFGLLLELPGGAPAEKEDPQEGDPRYMAPELLHGQYGPAADVFSLGVSILELACNMEVPKGGAGWQQLRRGYLPPEFTNALSLELQAVLRMMLTPDPSQRPTAAQLLALPAVRGHRRRRRLSLLLREALLTLASLCQSTVSCGWRVLSSVLLPVLPGWTSPLPATPPKDACESDPALSLSALDSGCPDDHDAAFLSEAPLSGLSPALFSHRLSSRLSAGSTSTPRPASPPPGPLLSAQTPRRPALHPASPQHGFTQTPSGLLLTSGTRHAVPTPPLSPIRSRPRSLTARSTRRWVPTGEEEEEGGEEEEAVPRMSFEPKNLLRLFDDTAQEGGP